jgi:hypothetical protein
MKVRGQKLTIDQQLYVLKNDDVSGKGVGKLIKGRLIWTFNARPSAMSRTYKAKLTYKTGETPKVTVLSPDIVELAGGRPLPHVYKQQPPQLCLCWPIGNEWHSGMVLTNTFICWTYVWLFYFECWLATDIWSGGGIHIDVKEESRKQIGDTHKA